MVTRHDLALLPTAVTLWVLAVVGTAHGVRAVVIGLMLVGCTGLTLMLLMRRTRIHRALIAHLLLLCLGTTLLLPGIGRHATTGEFLDDAVRTGAQVELTVTASTDARTQSAAMPWARDRLQVIGRTEPGVVRIGREHPRVPGSARVLVTGGPETGLDTVRNGRLVAVRGTLTRHEGLFILSASQVTSVARGDGPFDRAAGARDLLRERARTTSMTVPVDEAALARGMATGDTSGMSARVEEAMRRAGISHLVAVSGANIALVLAAILIPLLLLGVPRRPRILAASVAGAGYVFLVGDEPSVLRAATMAAPILAARFVGVRASPVAALAFTLAVWSCLDPETSAQVGFLLSALATAAILILAPPMAEAVARMSGDRIPVPLALVLTVPLVAQLACTPVLVTLASEISIWAVAANMAVAPIVAPTTIVGMLATLFGPIAPDAATALWQVSAGGAHLVIQVALFADSLPGSRIPFPAGTIGVLLGVALLLAVVVAVLGHRSRVVRWMTAVVLVVTCAPPIAARLPVGDGTEEWNIAVCAVGQGDALLLRGEADASGGAAAGPVVLIDTGPEPEALRACLDTLQIRRIDLLVLTHPHMDHTGGREALVGARTPAAQWVCPLPQASGQVVPDVPVHAVSTGESWSAPGLDLDVLWPPSAEEAEAAAAREQGSGEGDAANDCSVTIRAELAEGRSLVALGDLEPEAQSRLAAREPRSADVVKVAHHGSRRQDPVLYEHLDPETMLYTAGADNTFGHPTADALALATRSEARIIRTDRHGTVTIPRSAPHEPVSVGPAR